MFLHFNKCNNLQIFLMLNHINSGAQLSTKLWFKSQKATPLSPLLWLIWKHNIFTHTTIIPNSVGNSDLINKASHICKSVNFIFRNKFNIIIVIIIIIIIKYIFMR